MCTVGSMVKPCSEPWLLHEDEHLLAVHKPAGVNTHRADVHAQDGMYEWVQRQRSADSLSVLHRLDKATSGVLVFGKTTEANRSLTRQFEQRTVRKSYELVTAGHSDSRRSDVPIDGSPASTEFELAESGPGGVRYVAHPYTGRTHQVRIHARALGIPIIGDRDHGGADGARLFLHAAGLRIEDPDGSPLELTAERPASLDRLLGGAGAGSASLRARAAHESRAVLFDPADTDAHLWIDRHHDGFPDIRVERLAGVALVLDYRDTTDSLPSAWLDAIDAVDGVRAIFVQKRPRGGAAGPAQLVSGSAPERFDVTELGVRYRIDLAASATSSGLFLDQRETRRELLHAQLAGATVLNTFAHTGSLSVAAALAGAETMTLDLSKHYLEWARENLRLNGVDPGDHDFIYGDAPEWMDRLHRKGRRFDLVLVDPPSTSTSRKGSKRWSVERDLHALVARAATLASSDGTVYVSTNYRKMGWPKFIGHIERGLSAAGRRGVIDPRTLPLDHRSGPGDAPYLKGAWVRLDR